MLDIKDALESGPNAFVSALPAGHAVDLVMSQYGDLTESSAPHASSPACLQDWVNSDNLYLNLSSCTNPETLLVAFERYTSDRIRRVVVTNPATPRTAEVVAATQDLASRGPKTFFEVFAEAYLSVRRAEFDRDTHRDLVDTLENEGALFSERGGLDLLLAGLEATSSILYLIDNRLADDHLFSPAWATEINTTLDRLIMTRSKFVTGRHSDGSLMVDPSEVHSNDLADLLGRHPNSMSSYEKDQLRDLIMDPRDYVTSSREEFVLRLGAHALTLDDLQNLPLQWASLRDLTAEPQPEITDTWAEEWAQSGLEPLNKVRVGELPWTLARSAGRELYARMGDDKDAWVTALSLIDDGWDGTLGELAGTATATV